MGLVVKLPIPVIVIGLLLNAAIGVNILMPRPLSPQLMVLLPGLTPPETICKCPLSNLVTTAPSF